MRAYLYKKHLIFFSLFYILVLLILIFPQSAEAATCTASNGNWSSVSTWNCGHVPLATDDVVIPNTNNVNVTVNANAVASTITFTGGNRSNAINISGTNSLTVTNAITINAPSTDNRTKEIVVGSGTLNSGSININSGSSTTRVSQVTVSTGTINVTGNITFSGTALSALLTSLGSSTINIGGTNGIGTGGTFAASTGTVNYNRAGTQTIGLYNYNNLTISGSGAKTLSGTTIVNGNLNISTGTLDVSTSNYGLSVKGNWTNNGIFTPRNGTVTFNGTGTQYINSANSWYNLAITGTVARTVILQSGVLQTVSNNLVLTGSSGQLLTLSPSTSPTKWQISAPATQTISYVSPSYSDASSGTAINAINGTNNNGGNNINWNFAPILTIPSSTGNGSGSYGGTPAGPVAYNAPVSITATPNVSSIFTGWVATGAATACNGSAISPCAFNMTSSASVTANYILKTYTLTYTAGAHGSIVGTTPQTVSYNTSGTLVTATPDLGYHFVSWSDGVLTAARTDLNVVANISVTASFAIDMPTKFVIVSASNGTTDLPSLVIVQAQDASGTLIDSYQQDVTLVTSGSAIGGGLIDIINGVGTASISDTIIESVHLSLLDSEVTILDVSSVADISFSAGTVAKLSISTLNTEMVAGNLLPITISRRDSSNNLVTIGSESFYLYSNSLSPANKFYDTATDGNIVTEVLISDGFSSANIWYYDEKIGSSKITVSDNVIAPDGVTGIDDGLLDVTVISAPTAALIINNPGNLLAGQRLKYDVSRQDQFGNLSTNGNVVIYLYRSPSLSSTVFYDADIGGNQISSLNISSGVAMTSFWLYSEKAGNLNITVSDNSSAPDGAMGIVDATDSLIVSPNLVAALTLSNPGDMTIDTRLGYTVSRFDVYNNPVSSGELTVYLYHNAPATTVFYDAVLGGNTITSLVIPNGSDANNFWLYSNDTGNYNIIVSDNSSAPDGATGITDAVDAVTISPIPIVPTRFIISDTIPTIAGDTAVINIRAEDDLGNLANSYNNSVTLHTNGNATPGGIVTITNGLGSINIIDLKAETVDLSLEDTAGNGLNVSSLKTVSFLPGPTANFIIIGAGNALAGERTAYTITRKDQYDNLVTDGTDMVYLYDNATSGTAAFYNAASAGVQISFGSILNGSSSTNIWFVGTKVGSWMIDASDNVIAPDGATGINDGIHAISISHSAVARLILNDPGDMLVGTRLGYIATRYDAYNNLVITGAANYYLYSNNNDPSATFYNVSSGGSPTTSIVFSDGNSTANFWYYEDKIGTWTVYISDNSSAPDGAMGITDGEDSIVVSMVPIVATKFIIITSSSSFLVGTPVTVTVRAVDNNDNIDTTYQNDVTLNISGSAVGGGLIDIINGVGQVLVTDSIEENINLALEDTEGTGLNISFTRNISFTATVIITSGGGSGSPTIINPTVSFSGKAFPQANVEIMAIQAGQVPVGNLSKSSTAGNFNINYSGTLPVNVKSFALVVYDKDQKIVQTKIFNLGVNNEIIKTILMAPTLSLKQLTVTKGTFMGVTGSAVPNYKIELMVDGVNVAETAIADINGNYDITFNTYYLDLGEHVLRVRQIDNQGKASDYSIEKSFSVSKLFIPKADFNNDGKVDVQDLFIFISRFRSIDAVNRQDLDLNNDGKVDVQDLSVFIGALSR